MLSIENIRRLRLDELISEFGTQAALAKKIERSSAQISQWKNQSPDSKTGKPRSMDSASARHIEKMTGKADGWMDQMPNGDISFSDLSAHEATVVALIRSASPDQAGWGHIMKALKKSLTDATQEDLQDSTPGAVDDGGKELEKPKATRVRTPSKGSVDINEITRVNLDAETSPIPDTRTSTKPGKVRSSGGHP